jgi:hypothetical protein
MRYVVEFEPLPGVDVIRSLRRLLRYALRACGLRCRKIEPAGKWE